MTFTTRAWRGDVFGHICLAVIVGVARGCGVGGEVRPGEK